MDNNVMFEGRDKRNAWGMSRIIRVVMIVALVAILIYLLKDHFLSKEQLENMGLESPSVIELSPIEIKGIKGGFL